MDILIDKFFSFCFFFFSRFEWHFISSSACSCVTFMFFSFDLLCFVFLFCRRCDETRRRHVLLLLLLLHLLVTDNEAFKIKTKKKKERNDAQHAYTFHIAHIKWRIHTVAKAMEWNNRHWMRLVLIHDYVAQYFWFKKEKKMMLISALASPSAKPKKTKRKKKYDYSYYTTDYIDGWLLILMADASNACTTHRNGENHKIEDERKIQIKHETISL